MTQIELTRIAAHRLGRADTNRSILRLDAALALQRARGDRCEHDRREANQQRSDGVRRRAVQIRAERGVRKRKRPPDGRTERSGDLQQRDLLWPRALATAACPDEPD